MTIGTTTTKRIRAHASRQITGILDRLGVQYTQNGPLIQACCPCSQHNGDGDNETAFSWKEGVDRWVCWTHGCENEFGNDVFGLVRSIHQCSFGDAVQWVREVLSDCHVNVQEEATEDRPAPVTTPHVHQPIDEMRLKFLQPNHPFLAARNFRPDIVSRYEVGYWNRLGTYMHDRIVCPVRDLDGFLIGFTGRTIHPKSEWSKRNIKSKWIHGQYFDRFPKKGVKEFVSTSVIYNLHNAKKFIASNNGTIVLEEGTFDGYRLEEADIFNWGGVLGARTFSAAHRSLLLDCGVNRILLAFDQDEAGELGRARVRKVVGNLMKVEDLRWEGDRDLAEMSVDEVRKVYNFETQASQSVTD